MWIERYEKEQRNHIETNTELLKLRGDYQDNLLAFKNLQIQADSLHKTKFNLEGSNGEL